ncbi:MAG: ferredoxin [Candidatus Omnitrophica bacterium]|nr:ferredoxin [Candidatus Omnitrophota bacterium]
MKVFVNPEVCIGCTLCTQICPEVFKMHEDKSTVYVNPVPEKLKDSCRQAVESCPVNAITQEG